MSNVNWFLNLPNDQFERLAAVRAEHLSEQKAATPVAVQAKKPAAKTAKVAKKTAKTAKAGKQAASTAVLRNYLRTQDGMTLAALLDTMATQGWDRDKTKINVYNLRAAKRVEFQGGKGEAAQVFRTVTFEPKTAAE